MNRAFLIVLMQLAVITAGLAQTSSPLTSLSNDPYTLNNGKPFAPIYLPIELQHKRIYGMIALQIKIDTLITKVKEVYVLRTDLKNKSDGSSYLDYRYSEDFDKIDTYPKKLKELYSFLMQYATRSIEIQKIKGVAPKSKLVTYDIPVVIEHK